MHRIRASLAGKRFLCTASVENLRAGFNEMKVSSSSLPPQVAATMALQTASQKEVVSHKIHVAIDRFKKHSVDTGSSAVQSMSFFLSFFLSFFSLIILKLCCLQLLFSRRRL